jgi:hypothetical protein
VLSLARTSLRWIPEPYRLYVTVAFLLLVLGSIVWQYWKNRDAE